MEQGGVLTQPCRLLVSKHDRQPLREALTVSHRAGSGFDRIPVPNTFRRNQN